MRSIAPRGSLLWHVFAANAAVLIVAVGSLAFLPVTVSWPVSRGELILMAVGTVVMLAVNLVLLRRIFTPLARLRETMAAIDPLRPGDRVDVGTQSPEVVALAGAFNEMLDRLEGERRVSSRQAQAAQEQERRALSLELHDEIGQNLTALLLQLDVALQTADAQQRRTLTTAVATVRDCLDQVRAIVRRLRPEALEDLGLVGAIGHLCSRVARDTGLRVERSLDRSVPALNADAQLVVYRVTQESLTNIVRHAEATRATVWLAPHGDGVRLTVADDGRGAQPLAEGSGIRGMRERALMIGATLRVAPRVPTGLEVVLDVPGEERRA